jgi:hypothetical protein
MVQTTKTISRDLLMNELLKKFPKMFLRTTEEFNGSHGGIWTSGENGLEFPNGDLVFNYWYEGFNGHWKAEKYIIGVHNKLYKYLQDRGWYASWYDPGTIMIWPIQVEEQY